MTPYLNSNQNSGIAYFEIHQNFIRIQFKNSQKIYRYYDNKIGRQKLEEMKQLAMSGSGLGTYINKNRDIYASAIVE